MFFELYLIFEIYKRCIIYIICKFIFVLFLLVKDFMIYFFFFCISVLDLLRCIYMYLIYINFWYNFNKIKIFLMNWKFFMVDLGMFLMVRGILLVDDKFFFKNCGIFLIDCSFFWMVLGIFLMSLIFYFKSE